MIADADGAILALRDIPAVVADDASGVSFLIHQNSDSFALSEIFLYSLQGQLGKIRSELLGHIHQEDGLLGSLYIVVETFVVHTTVCMYWKKRRKPNAESKIDI